MLTRELIHHLSAVLTRKAAAETAVFSYRPLPGGDINDAFELFTNNGNYFVKVNSANRFPGMFETEAKGLNLLRKANGVRIPEVIGSGAFNNVSYLLLQMINPVIRQKDYWEVAGCMLASLHGIKTETFGLEYNNYIGSLPQNNDFSSSGADFLISRRFEPLVKMAFNNRLLTKVELEKFESFYKKLPDILPDEQPSLLHGDLWNGNMITGPDGCAWLIDPAVYFGYRETDLAMTRLFGGFDDIFYESYHQLYSLPENWEERVPLFQLYPLLVHLNLFGAGYYSQVMTAVKCYT